MPSFFVESVVGRENSASNEETLAARIAWMGMLLPILLNFGPVAVHEITTENAVSRGVVSQREASLVCFSVQ